MKKYFILVTLVALSACYASWQPAQSLADTGTMMMKPFPGIVPNKQVAKQIVNVIAPTVLGKRAFEGMIFTVEDQGACWVARGFPNNPGGESVSWRMPIFKIKKSNAATEFSIK